MKILGWNEKTYRCDCRKCGCIFIIGEHEFLPKNYNPNYNWPTITCPHCGHKAGTCFFDMEEYIEENDE